MIRELKQRQIVKEIMIREHTMVLILDYRGRGREKEG